MQKKNKKAADKTAKKIQPGRKVKQEFSEPTKDKDVVVEQQDRESHSGVNLWALVIIFIGAILLLNNLGILTWNIWVEIVRFWPVFIIIAGLQLLFGRSKIFNFAVSATAFLFVIALILALIILFIDPSKQTSLRNLNFLNTSTSTTKETLGIGQQDYSNISSRKIKLEMLAGEFQIDDNENNNYIMVDATYPANFLRPVLSSTQKDNELRIDFETEKDGFWVFPFTNSENIYNFSIGQNSIPTELSVELTAGEGNTKLSRLVLNSLNIEMLAGNLSFDLSGQSVPEEITMKLIAGDLKIQLPKDVEIDATYKITAGTLSIDSEKFDSLTSEGTYQSPVLGPISGGTKINIEVVSGSIEITRK